MTTSTRRLDTTDLQARVKSMYEQVATEPHQGFHFETGGDLAALAVGQAGTVIGVDMTPPSSGKPAP